MIDDLVLQTAAEQPDLAGCLMYPSNEDPTTIALRGAVHRVLTAAQQDCARRYAGFALQVQPSHTRAVCQLLACLHTRQLRTGLLISSAVGLDVARLVAQLSGAQLHVADQLLSSKASASFKAKFVELLMQAGTKEEKVVLAVDVTSANAEVLSILRSFVAGGTVEDLLSPDNMVAVATLTQPKVLAMGLSPSPHVVWTTFAEVARRHFQVVLLLPRPGATCNTHLERMLVECPSLVSSLNIILWQDAATNDLLVLAQEATAGVATEALELAQQTPSTASHLLSAMHQAVKQSKPLQRNDFNVLALISTASFRRLTAFAGAAANAGYAHAQARLTRYLHGVALTEQAELKLELLLQRHQTLALVVQEKQSISTRVLTQMGRDVAAQRKAGQVLAEGGALLAQLQAEALPLKEAYVTSLDEATVHTDAMHALRNQLSDSVVQGVQKLVRPLPVVETLFAAVMLLLLDGTAAALSDAELAWRTGGKRLCADPVRFRSQLQAVEMEEVPPQRLLEVQELTRDPELHVLMDEAAASMASSEHDDDLPLGLHMLAAWVKAAVLLHQQLNSQTRVRAEAHNDVLARIVEVETDIASATKRQESLTLRVASLRESFETSTRLKNDHTQEFEQVKLELSQAEGMLDILSQERADWAVAMRELEVARVHALGHGLLAGAVRTYLPGLSQPLRQTLLVAWLRLLRSFGVPFSGQPVEGAAESMADEGFDLNLLLPLICCKRVVLGGVLHGDDGYMFVNRAALMASDRWCLVVDADGLGASHVAQATASLDAEGSQVSTLDLGYGSVAWGRLEAQLEDLLASKRSVLLTNAPYQPMGGMVKLLRMHAQHALQRPSVSLDNQGHLVEPTQQQRVFIAGSHLDIGAWQHACQGFLAVVSYADLTKETQQQCLGAQLLSRLYPSAMSAAADNLQKVDQVELALEASLDQLVGSFDQTQVQSDVVEATVQQKHALQKQLDQLLANLHQMDAMRDSCDSIAALPALVIRYAHSMGNMVGIDLHQPSAIMAQFFAVLEDHDSMETRAVSACVACWQRLRESLPAQHLLQADISFYLQVWVPVQRALHSHDLRTIQPEASPPADSAATAPADVDANADGTADAAATAEGAARLPSLTTPVDAVDAASSWLPSSSQTSFLLDPPCPSEDSLEPAPVSWITPLAVRHM